MREAFLYGLGIASAVANPVMMDNGSWCSSEYIVPFCAIQGFR